MGDALPGFVSTRTQCNGHSAASPLSVYILAFTMELNILSGVLLKILTNPEVGDSLFSLMEMSTQMTK